MAIYNTITIATSGSKGWDSEFLNLSQYVDYFYAPYEGSFLYANSGDFIQPFEGSPPIYQSGVVTPFAEGDDPYPIDQQHGRAILKFPRLKEQNPQITSANSYYPYNEDTGVVTNTKVAEYTALPSIHLQLTIQPVKFGAADTLNSTKDSINDLSANYCPMYVEIVGTSNASYNSPTRASDYVEDSIINVETLQNNLIHEYGYQRIEMGGGSAFNSYNNDVKNTPPSVQFPLGNRDLYFQTENPSLSGEPTLVSYEGDWAYVDEVIKLIPPVQTPSNLQANGWGWEAKLVQHLRHLVTPFSYQFSGNGAGEIGSNTLRTDAMIGVQPGLSVPTSPNASSFTFPLQGNMSITDIKSILRPSTIYYSNGTVETDSNPIPMRLIIAGTKTSGVTSQVERISVGTSPNTTTQSIWNFIAVVEIISYNEANDSLTLKTKKSLYPGGTNLWNWDESGTINATTGHYRIFLNPPIPIPTFPSLEGLTSPCDFQISIPNNGIYPISEKIFRAAYAAYSWVRAYNYNNETGDLITNTDWTSPVLNQTSTGGNIYYNSAYNSWYNSGNPSNSNFSYIQDRNTFYGQTSSPWNYNLSSIDYCYIDTTIKYNPQRFGLVYDIQNQEFILQIPHIPPCIIKGTYQVF